MMADCSPVSVVVVNYNRASLLVECLESLLVQRLPPREIIVVDNGSRDDSARLVKQEFGSKVKLIELSKNLGFAGGNNAGIRAAESEWIALINNDARADKAWLFELMREAEKRPAAGMVGCRILVESRREFLDNTGVAVWPDGMSRGANHFLRDAEVAESSFLLPSGCAVLLKKSAFTEAGGFDESFFCYSEDTDLFLRILLLGYECAFAERAYVYHRGGGGTLGLAEPRRIFLAERNRTAVLLRYFPWTYILASPFFTLLRAAGLSSSLLAYAARAGTAEKRAQKEEGRNSSVGLSLLLGSAWAFVRAQVAAAARARGDLKVRREWGRKSRVPRELLRVWLSRGRLDWRSLVTLER